MLASLIIYRVSYISTVVFQISKPRIVVKFGFHAPPSARATAAQPKSASFTKGASIQSEILGQATNLVKSYQYLSAWPADGLWHPKCHKEADFLVSPELAPEKKSKKCGRRMEERNPKRRFLVGGFNPFEKSLVKLEHFPK